MIMSLFALCLAGLAYLTRADNHCLFFADDSSIYSRSDIETCFDTVAFDQSAALSLIDNVRIFASLSSEQDRLRGETDSFDDVYLDYDTDLLNLKLNIESNTTIFANEFELHQAITNIFRKARDPHFTYTAPMCFGTFQYILPYSFQAQEVDGTTHFYFAETASDIAAVFRQKEPELAEKLSTLVGKEVTFIDGERPYDKIQKLATDISFASKSLPTRINAVVETEFHMGTTFFGWPHEDKVRFTVDGHDVEVPFVYVSLRDVLSDSKFMELCNEEVEVPESSFKEFRNMRVQGASFSSLQSSLALNMAWNWRNCRTGTGEGGKGGPGGDSESEHVSCDNLMEESKWDAKACGEFLFDSGYKKYSSKCSESRLWDKAKECAKLLGRCPAWVCGSVHGTGIHSTKPFASHILSAEKDNTTGPAVTHVFDIQNSLISYDIVEQDSLRFGVLWFGSFDPNFDVNVIQTLMQEVARTSPDRLLVDVRGNSGGYVTLGNQLAWWINSKMMRPSTGMYRRRLDPLTKRLFENGLGSLLGPVEDYLTHDDLSWDRVISKTETVTLKDRFTGEPLTSEYSDFFTMEAYEWFDKDGNIQTRNTTLGLPILEMEPASVVILSNGVCGSACATFAWNMRELGGVRFVNVGGVWENGELISGEAGFASFPGGTVVGSGMVISLMKKLGLTPGKDGMPAPLLHGASLSIPWLTMYSRYNPSQALEWIDEPADFYIPFHGSPVATHGFYDGEYSELMSIVIPIFHEFMDGDVAITSDCANTTSEVRGREFQTKTGLFDGECVRLYCAEPYYLDFTTNKCVKTPYARSLKVPSQDQGESWKIACIVVSAVFAVSLIIMVVLGSVKKWWSCGGKNGKNTGSVTSLQTASPIAEMPLL